MPFERNNTEVQKRKDRSIESVGKRRRSSLESKPWTPSQLALKQRYLALEGAEFWFPLTLDEKWIGDHSHLPMLHIFMDTDLSRFKTVVLEPPGQLWAGSCGKRWKDFCRCVGFSWMADWQSHLVVQGADSKGKKITWINFHPNPSSCPLNVLRYAQPPLNCTRWRRKLGSIGCLNDGSSDDDSEHADDEGGVGECPKRTRALLKRAPEVAKEANNLVVANDADERRTMLELLVPSGGAAPQPRRR